MEGCPACTTAVDTTQNILNCNVASGNNSAKSSTVDPHLLHLMLSPFPSVTILPSLMRLSPSYHRLSRVSFLWNNTIEGSDFVDCVAMANEVVFHWKKNVPLVKLTRSLCRNYHTPSIFMERGIDWKVFQLCFFDYRNRIILHLLRTL